MESLLYAAFTSESVLGLVRITSGSGNDGWLVLGDSALWLAFVSGGIGLILGKSWSRLVILVAAAVSVVLGILGMMSLSVSDMPLAAVLFDALAILPPVAILVGTLRLGAPAAWHAQPSSGSVAKRAFSPRIDLAYGCFAWIALMLCIIPLMLSLLDPRAAMGLSMLVALPILLATLAAGLTAVVLSIIEWREWPLVTMSAASISLPLLFLANEEWNLVGEVFAITWFICATAILVFLCVRWFALTRRRARQVQETDEQGP